MNFDSFIQESLNFLGDGATRPIEPRGNTPATLLRVAGMSLLLPELQGKALPSRRREVRAGASSCGRQA